MRTDGRRELRRPPGAVLRPLGLLAVAVVTGFGMWRALMQDGHHPIDRHTARHEHPRPDHPQDARP